MYQSTEQAERNPRQSVKVYVVPAAFLAGWLMMVGGGDLIGRRATRAFNFGHFRVERRPDGASHFIAEVRDETDAVLPGSAVDLVEITN